MGTAFAHWTLVKVSDRNSFRANQNSSDSFWYLYPSQCESFLTNPKNVLYLVWWETVKINPTYSDSIRCTNLNESEPRFQLLGLIQTEFSIRINLNHCDLGLVQNHSHWHRYTEGLFVRANDKNEWKFSIILF